MKWFFKSLPCFAVIRAEFTGKALDQWALVRGVEIKMIQAGVSKIMYTNLHLRGHMLRDQIQIFATAIPSTMRYNQ